MRSGRKKLAEGVERKKMHKGRWWLPLGAGLAGACSNLVVAPGIEVDWATRLRVDFPLPLPNGCRERG